ncbi:MAG: hypothetical protein JW925_14265 [Syntrophaceae bacterium]|nr:hypothetical protein [Syntrophaceae bacterium]
MNMHPEWKRKYEVLKEYVRSNPEIIITAYEVSIPEHLRNRFYDLFDDVRNAFIDPLYASMPFEMDALQTGYARAEKETVKALGIERVDLSVDLSSYLNSPKNGMQRWLYNRMFEMIQGKITEDDFERMASFDLSATAESMFTMGYGLWAFFSIILLLEPDEAFAVELNEDNEPVLADLKAIAPGRQFHDSVKRIPEFVIHSKRIEKYIAFKTPLAREVNAYHVPFEIPKKMMRDNTGDTSSVLDSRVIFLSIIPDLKSIPVFVEMHNGKLHSPDIMVEFLTHRNMSDSNAIFQVQNRAKIMRPALGGAVVLINPGDETDIAKLEEKIDVFPAGLNASRLQPIVDKLA